MRRGGDAHARRGSRAGQRHRDRSADRGRVVGGISSFPRAIEHWNGKRWKALPSPNPPSGYLNLLWAASATSRDNIWAVGTTDYGSTLIVHWNGAAWS